MAIQNPLIYAEVAGNPDFSSEKLPAYEAGYRNTMTRRLYLDFSAFYNHYNDLNNYGMASIIGVASPPPPHFVLIFPSSPWHEVMFQSLINLPKHFEFDQTFRYVSALPALSVPSYDTADVRLGWRPHQRLEFSVSGQNLLQPRHIEFINDPGSPAEIKRDVYSKITFRC